MNGQNTFTTSQIEELKKLIADKVHATTDKQKGIRDKIRELGFYYTDFSMKKNGYTVEDFETLIQSGLIKVIKEKDQQKIKNTTMALSNLDTGQLQPLLQVFKQNRFDPGTDNERIIPDKPGNYILCLKQNSSFPGGSISPTFTIFNGLKVIYTGISRKNLRKRDYHQHFNGNNAGCSTLRKSLGVLFGYKQIPRDKDPNNGKTKFGQTDEQLLTEWMTSNIMMYFLSTTDPTKNLEIIEIKLIEHFNPPLNLISNHNSINADFRKWLSFQRSQK